MPDMLRWQVSSHVFRDVLRAAGRSVVSNLVVLMLWDRWLDG
jgi:hypothetical protein